MKTLEEIGIQSEKTMTENEGTRRESVLSPEPIKKKVRKIVKKIVKKKVIKKVPKRVSVVPNCNDLEKVASSSPNDDVPMEIEDFVSVETEKPNVVDDNEEGNGAGLDENIDSCRDECESGGLVTASLLRDRNLIELQDREHDINTMDVEEHEGDCVKEQGEKSECVGVKMEVGLSNDVKGEEGVKALVEKREHIDLKPGDSAVKELVENSETDGSGVEQGLSESRVLSGEMGTSERQTRGSTEVFINGLDMETKEEDVRNVFEEVGEVIGVRLVTNHRTGKNRGFGFIRYASAADAKLAVTKYNGVEICGRPCRTAIAEGHVTILINNIDKRWNSGYVLALLQKIGIKKIDKVSVVADPENTELNRGFAFLELETKRDAQIAYHKLQNKNVFGKHSKIKVAWANKSSVAPDEEATHNVKSVYAEHIPSSWDEEEVKNHFKIFGEIESIALAKNLRTAKRDDFAFINYTSCEAALSCIKALTCEQSTNDNSLKAHMKVSLAKSIPKGKQSKTIAVSTVTKHSKVKQKTNRALLKSHKPRNTIVSSISRHEDARTDGGSSTTAELVQLLREQASWKLAETGASNGHRQTSPRGNRPFSEWGSESLFHDPRVYHQTRLEIHNAVHPRFVVCCLVPIFSSARITSLKLSYFFKKMIKLTKELYVLDPQLIANRLTANGVAIYNHQHANYTSGSLNRVEADPRYFQTRDQVTYHGSSSVYRRMY